FISEPQGRPAKWRALWGYLFGESGHERAPGRAGAARRQRRPRLLARLRLAGQAVPFALLAVAAWQALEVDHSSDRIVFVLVPIAVAAVLFVAPWSAASGVGDPRSPRLIAVRALVAAA